MVLVRLCNLLVCGCVLGTVVLSVRREEPLYSNEFAVHIPEGNDVADEIATKHDFVNRGQVSHRFVQSLFIHRSTLCCTFTCIKCRGNNFVGGNRALLISIEDLRCFTVSQCGNEIVIYGLL
jgi:hypothetical protein